MPMNDIFNEIYKRVDLINKKALNLSEDIYVFEDINIKKLKSSPSELGFLYLIALLYISYFECGKIGVKFLIGKMEAFNLCSSKYELHLRDVNDLRTYLYHNLSYTNAPDVKRITRCKNWFEDSCGSADIGEEAEWNLCLEHAYNNTIELLNDLEDVICFIEADDFKYDIIDDWRFSINNRITKYECEIFVGEIADYLGKEVNEYKLTNVYFSKWCQEVKYENYTDKCEYLQRIRKAIEGTLIREIRKSLPISGKDIMEKFSLSGGKKIGELLLKATEIFETDENMSKQDILDRLKAQI